MIARISTALSLTLTALSLGAHAAATPNDGVSKAAGSPLQARQSICCPLAQDNRYIQTVCQYMYENCGGWSNCLKGQPNDQHWCTYCVVTHPEDPACLKNTWPPAYPAPIHKRDLKEATILPPPKPANDNAEAVAPVSRRSLDMAPDSEDLDTTSKHLDKREQWYYGDTIYTKNLQNQAQSFRRTFGLVTIRIIISALNVMTYSVENAGATDVIYRVIDKVSGWTVEKTCPSGQTLGGGPGSQVLAKGGDSFTVAARM